MSIFIARKRTSAISRSLLAGSAIVLLAGLPGAALAQAADDTPADGEIIVTANKRAEDVTKVPVAISVLGGDELRTLGVNSVSDVQNVAADVQVDRTPFGVNIAICGVTTTDNTSKGAQGIAFNVDGIYIGRPAIQGLAFSDV